MSTRQDPDSYEEFVRRFAENDRRIYAYIMAFLHNHNDAEEVFQETSLILWREFHKFRLDEDFMPWALGISFNQIRKFRRRRKNQLGLSDSLLGELAKDAAEVSESLDARGEALRLCLQSLSQRNREMIELFYGTRTSAGQIAKQWNRTVHAVYKALKVVRRTLLECINQQLEVEEAE